MPQHLTSDRLALPMRDPAAGTMVGPTSGAMTDTAAARGTGADATAGIRTEAATGTATDMATDTATDMATDTATDTATDMGADMGADLAAVVTTAAVAGSRPVRRADTVADPRGAALPGRVAADRHPRRDRPGGTVAGGIPPLRLPGAAPASRWDRWIAALRRLATRSITAWSAAARRRRTRIRLTELDDRRLADIGLRRVAPPDPPIRLDRNW